MANCLQHFGFDYEVFEQAPELTEVGAGIGMSKAAIDIFDKLGLLPDLKSAGRFIKYATLKNKNLRITREIPVEVDSICIHRAKLIDVLALKIPREKVNLNKRAVSIEKNKNTSVIHFADGSQVTSNCVVVADGINSAIRRKIFPEIQIRYPHQVIWRGLTNMKLPQYYSDRYVEIWDDKKRFLFTPMNDDHIFWVAIKNGVPHHKDNGNAISELLEEYKDFDSLVKQLIKNSNHLIRNDLADLGGQKRKWYSGNVVFLGDAIHATTPNLAQGACQAMEDAYCLSLCFKKYGDDLQKVFTHYQTRREDKAMFIVNTSWKLGQMAHSKSFLLYNLYKLFWKIAPDKIFTDKEKKINDLSYIDSL
jgi:2-polyprenyl-6-methoxyphenol hydroxylase-like FAD-dependent oxidoreductase